MGYCCEDCGGSDHTCTAWDGKGNSRIGGRPNHNLVEKCPKDITKCEYRHQKSSLSQ